LYKVLLTSVPLLYLLGFKVLEVIEARADVYCHVTAIKKWDLCAGYAMISAMGGTMSTLGGDSIDFSGDTEPLNTKGVMAFMHHTPAIDKLKTIRIPNS
jgi:inositol monophosphatase 3